MPYYKEKNLLFIHIPKTGGTIIENELKKKTPEELFSRVKCLKFLIDPPYNKVTPQHQFYSTLYDYRKKLNINFENIKVFSIVRNPYDRIISDLLHLKLIKVDYTPELVFENMKYNFFDRSGRLDNHEVPQYKYVTDEDSKLIPHIKIFKCEKLNECNTELNRYIGIDINIKQENVNKDYSKYLNKDSISLINDYYKKDFEMFGYKLK